MTDFLTSSACRGRRPKSLGIQRQYPRGDLLAKMIRKRNTVRFLVAPPLFGKTMLVAEYADSVFSFENVFWLQAKSPCFLRDLDRKAIAPALLKKGEKPSLAIFEDIPLLDEGRAEALSAVFDELLSQGCEVIATMTPHCDVFREHQPDAVWLKTQEFLLTDTEINARRSDFEQLAHPVASLPISQRIPGIFWGDTKAHEKFCQAIVKEELAIDELLTIFIMLILENGYLSDITNFVKGWDAGLLENLQSDYAYLGIDTYREQFAACSLSLNNIAKAFTPSLDAMAIHSNFGDKSSLVCHLANLLVTGDNPERACGLVLRMCPPYQRASWLEENFEQLFRQGCFLPAHQVFESIKSSNISYGSKLSVIEAWCLAFLGDETRALRGVARLYLALDLDKETRALAALLLIRFGQKSQAKKALALLGNLIEYDSTSAKGYGGQQAIQRIAGQGFLWEILAFGQLCIHHQRAALTDFLEALRSAGAPSQGLGLLLVWLLDDIHLLLEGGASGEEKQQTTAYLRYVATYLERRSRANDIGFSDVLLLAKFERVVALTGDADSMALVPRSLVTFAHEMEVSLFGQQNSYQRLRKEAVEKRSEFRRTHPDELRSDATEVTSQTKFAPLLRVRLFGGLEVRV
ncbi:MAG: hypothetical protein LBB35_03975, partial [Coriobacteriaceae bacterium]|nr:hypothetical protein [Coriobacteriaceae bacterium]